MIRYHDTGVLQYDLVKEVHTPWDESWPKGRDSLTKLLIRPKRWTFCDNPINTAHASIDNVESRRM